LEEEFVQDVPTEVFFIREVLDDQSEFAFRNLLSKLSKLLFKFDSCYFGLKCHDAFAS